MPDKPTLLPTRAALLTSTAITRTPAFGTSLRLPALTPSVRLPADKLDVAPLFDAAVFLPRAMGGINGIDVDYAIGCIAVFCSRIHHKLSAQFSREWAETTVIRKLREGRLDLARTAIEQAHAGDEIYHNALQYLAAEMMAGPGRPGPEAPPGLLPVWTYGQLALQQGTRKRRAGRPGHDNWVRDAEYCTIIWLICHELGVSPGRNRASHGSKSPPSGCSLLVAALKRNGIHPPDEAQMEVNIWNGPRGRLVREELDKEFGGCV
jgi:hypothetical protein